jgi:hypothetical protein
MKKTFKILHDTPEIPTGERAEIAAKEIARRAAAVREGRADSRPWREALDEIDREILGR